MRQLASAVFLVASVLIGLGALGHGSQGAHLHASIDQFPIEPGMASMLYVVWYFVSGFMLLCGATLIWVWLRLRRGDRSRLFPAWLIGALYLVTGVAGMIYRHGDPFMATFIVLGGLVLACSLILQRGQEPAA